MTEEKKHDDTPEVEPEKLSEEEMKDAAGGIENFSIPTINRSKKKDSSGQTGTLGFFDRD